MRYRMAPANVTIAAKTSPPAMTHTAKGFARIPELVLNPCSIATISTLRNQQRERDSLFSKSARTLPRKARNRSPRLNVIVESNWPKSDTFKSGLHPSALFPQTRRSWSSYAGGGRGHARLVRRTQAEGRVRRASQRPSRRAPGHRQGPGHSVIRLSAILRRFGFESDRESTQNGLESYGEWGWAQSESDGSKTSHRIPRSPWEDGIKRPQH